MNQSGGQKVPPANSLTGNAALFDTVEERDKHIERLDALESITA
jgi:hypothetical protein